MEGGVEGQLVVVVCVCVCLGGLGGVEVIRGKQPQWCGTGKH